MADPNKMTASECKLYTTLRRNAGVLSIQEVADTMGVSKGSCQVGLSNLRRKLKAAGHIMPEPKKMARGGGGSSVNLEDFINSLDNQDDYDDTDTDSFEDAEVGGEVG